MSEVRVQEFDGSRHMDFHPLPERRLIIHMSGEVEIWASDGAKRVLRAGDIRLMEDVTPKGHSHNDLTPSAAVYVLLNDWLAVLVGMAGAGWEAQGILAQQAKLYGAFEISRVSAKAIRLSGKGKFSRPVGDRHFSDRECRGHLDARCAIVQRMSKKRAVKCRREMRS